jgi:hypothetical protein
MDLKADTYIVLDLSSPVDEKVLKMRKELSFFFSSIPAEITITGSSGVGPISQGQDVNQFTSILEEISNKTEPIQTRFYQISYFQNHGVYFLEPIDQDPFKSLHNQFLESGLRFMDSPFPYFAHCTIKIDHQNEIKDPENVLSMDYPKEIFNLKTLSVYSLSGIDCKLQYRTELKGKPNH